MLLQAIRDGAVDSKADISNVLRMCLVLAAKLGTRAFAGGWTRNSTGTRAREMTCHRTGYST